METDNPVKSKFGGPSAPPYSSMATSIDESGPPNRGDESSGSETLPEDPSFKYRRPGREHLTTITRAYQSIDDTRWILYSRFFYDYHDSTKRDKMDCQSKMMECLRDEFGRYPTILHWIVQRAEHEPPEVSGGFIVLIELIKIALKLDPSLLVERDRRNDTALHMAIASEGLGPLVNCICAYTSEPMIRRALAMTNGKGETCVHLAVVEGDLDIAVQMVKKSDPDMLLWQRFADGKNLEGGGNTPLHDAVAYKRCVIEEPQCQSKDDWCIHCFDIRNKSKKKRENILQLVELLVSKNPKALIVKNAANESPYLHYLSTRENLGNGNTTSEPREIQVHSQAFRSGSLSMPPIHTEVPFTPGNTISEDMRPNFKPNFSGNGRQAYGSNEDPKVDQPAWSSGQPVPWIGNHPKDGAMPYRNTAKCCIVHSGSAADEVAQYLLECSFQFVNFEDTCKCFFGDTYDKDYKDPNFRPGHALWKDDIGCYEDLLDPPSIMSQVDLIVPHIEPLDSTPVERQRRKQEDLWKDGMDALRSVFDLIRKKGVKRILRLTVFDHSERPCSDEVIRDCLRGFDVRFLDWKKNDLCIDILLDTAPRIVELWLYTNCNNTVLRGWAANNGICSLQRLTVVHLTARKNLEPYDSCVEKVKLFNQEVKENVRAVRTRLLLQSKRDIILNWLDYERTNQPKMERRLTSLDKHINDVAEKLGRITEQKKKHKSKGRPSTKMDLEYTIYENQYEHAGKCRKDLEKAHKLSKEKIESFKLNVTELIAEIKKLDEDREGARIQKLLVPFQNSAGERLWDDSKIEKEASSLNLAAWVLPWEMAQLESVPGLFSSRSGHLAWRFAINHRIEDETSNWYDDDPGLESEHSGDIETAMQPHRWLMNVKKFVHKHVPFSESHGSSIPEFRVKVALIDDGVDANCDELKGFIHPKGWPQEEPASNQYPFYHSANGHGTQMARLIRMICPKVQLYVAKLGAWTNERERSRCLGEISTAENARQAVAWAIKQDVHIISMSWSLVCKDGSDRSPSNVEQIRLLDEQIQEAARHGIIMYCAAADEGLYGSNKKLYPKKADTEHIRAVGSSMEHGQHSAFVDPHQVDYLFPGESIQDLDNVEGSSAATAFASGLAALILWCFHQHRSSEGIKDIADPKKMHEVFDSLKAKDYKWVDATKVFKEGNDVGNIVNYCSKIVEAAAFR